jgi:kojibiose phosphorylase
MAALLTGIPAPRVTCGAREGRINGTIHLTTGKPLVVEKRSAVATSRDLVPRPPLAVLRETADLTFEALRSEHVAIWQDRWERSDVVIEGDDRTQLALRASLYHLLRCHVPGDDRVTIDAKGYAGDAYFGRFFWDTEMYLLPFYLYTDPERARTFCDFRIRTLDGARANARRYGYRGARYGWESDTWGIDGCPNWQYGDHEVHVTADVVYGMVHYARAAAPNYLKTRAAETIVETARYWLNRIDRQPDGTPVLLGVMGPNEYTPISSNNAYTNTLVSFALRTAAEVGPQGGASADECRLFHEVADGLPIPRRGDLVLQCDGFDQLAEPRFEELWKDRTTGFANQVSQERLYRTKCLKQADTLMLMALFPAMFSDAECRAAWDYYLPLTTHDSSLSVGMHALMALRLELDKDAWAFFQQGLYKDVDVAHGGAAEGIHIAGCGCNWMIVVHGFAGLKTALDSETLCLQPRLPRALQRIAFPMIWKGTPIHVDLTHSRCAITNRGRTAISLEINGRTATVAPGQVYTHVLSS